jgi:peptide chain release factor 2
MIVELEKHRERAKELDALLNETAQAFNTEALGDELDQLHREMEAPDFWQNLERAQKVNQRIKVVTERTSGIEQLRKRIEDLNDLCDICDEEDDRSLLAEIEKELDDLSERIGSLHLSTLLRGEFDANDCILSLHAGAGGTEAQDWTEMLYRMYTRYCERHGYAVKELDFLEGDEAGVKSVTFEVSGENAYGYLKAERGVHRLVRISPFDSSARRHTSFASLDVMPELEGEGDFEINSEDLRIDTYRAGGAGGQHVNRTDSAVRITHLPSGIVAQCQNERSQVQNKETAMRMLRARLAELKEREAMERMADIKGELKKIEWGSQIRSYVFHPYSMVKDHRTSYEVGNTDTVMDGDLDGFITAFLQKM